MGGNVFKDCCNLKKINLSVCDKLEKIEYGSFSGCESLEEIKNYKIAVQNGDYMFDTFKKKFPNAQFIFAESNSEALKFVSYGKADVYIDNLPTISYFMEKNLLTNLEIKTKTDFEPSEISVAVLKEKKILKNIYVMLARQAITFLLHY